MMKNEKEVKEIIAYYGSQKNPKEQENLVSMLREIQETEGCIPAQAQKLAAEALGIKTAVLSCIVRRYPSLKEEAYRHEMVLCTGQRCQNKNSLKLLELIRKEFQIGEDGISADRSLQVSTRNCLRQCRTSPNLLLDGRLYTHMDKEKISRLARELKSPG